MGHPADANNATIAEQLQQTDIGTPSRARDAGMLSPTFTQALDSASMCGSRTTPDAGRTGKFKGGTFGPDAADIRDKMHISELFEMCSRTTTAAGDDPNSFVSPVTPRRSPRLNPQSAEAGAHHMRWFGISPDLRSPYSGALTFNINLKCRVLSCPYMWASAPAAAVPCAQCVVVRRADHRRQGGSISI